MLLQHVAEAHDVPQRLLQIMGRQVGELRQLFIAAAELGGKILQGTLQFLLLAQVSSDQANTLSAVYAERA
jgi:hypothetical protein